MSQDDANSPDKIASFKDALGDLRSDLASMKTESKDLDVVPEVEVEDSADVMDLKRRMAKSEEEMKAMTNAMKSTLLDVRTMMQDIDNPFDMLKSMGVDKLVNQAVQTVENEVIKAKQEERKKKMAEDDYEKPSPERIIIQSAPAVAAPMMPYPVQPMGMQPMPSQVPVAPTPVMRSAMEGTFPIPSVASIQPVITENNSNDEIMNRVEETEKSIKTLSEEVLKITKGIDRILEASNPVRPEPRMPVEHARTFRDSGSPQSQYYDTFVSLIAEYLTIKFGEEGANQLLLEGLYKGWASPRVVKDVRDNLPADSHRWDMAEGAIGYKIAETKTNVEDKILFTSLLGSLDKPINEWKEMTQVFLLLALVKSAKNKDSLMGE